MQDNISNTTEVIQKTKSNKIYILVAIVFILVMGILLTTTYFVIKSKTSNDKVAPKENDVSIEQVDPELVITTQPTVTVIPKKSIDISHLKNGSSITIEEMMEIWDTLLENLSNKESLSYKDDYSDGDEYFGWNEINVDYKAQKLEAYSIEGSYMSGTQPLKREVQNGTDYKVIDLTGTQSSKTKDFEDISVLSEKLKLNMDNYLAGKTITKVTVALSDCNDGKCINFTFSPAKDDSGLPQTTSFTIDENQDLKYVEWPNYYGSMSYDFNNNFDPSTINTSIKVIDKTLIKQESYDLISKSFEELKSMNQVKFSEEISGRDERSCGAVSYIDNEDYDQMFSYLDYSYDFPSNKLIVIGYYPNSTESVQKEFPIDASTNKIDLYRENFLASLKAKTDKSLLDRIEVKESIGTGTNANGEFTTHVIDYSLKNSKSPINLHGVYLEQNLISLNNKTGQIEELIVKALPSEGFKINTHL